MEIKFDWQGFFTGLALLFFAVIVVSLYIIAVRMAIRKGRSGFGWFLFSLIFSPIVTMIFIALLGETENRRHERIIEEEQLRNHLANKPNTKMKKCIQCAEVVQTEARVCRYCGYDFISSTSTKRSPSTFSDWKINNPNGTLNDFYANTKSK